MNYLVISCSLNPDSRSKILAESVRDNIKNISADVSFLDLAEEDIPFCDGAEAYSKPITEKLVESINKADGIVLCVPIYNYDINAAAKNLIELTGRNWFGKVVGFACAAGGQGSYMSIMSVANSLMLDFRCHIVPRLFMLRVLLFREVQLLIQKFLKEQKNFLMTFAELQRH